ncbi:autotransporter strand-loop-strand O-heptosyltransferase [Rhodopila sp.]|uniref:autotransporter strand-loop-strand O-heptosyltransferase n=1 Tax=Rhodopila sp. TaxID=2480087 RepID=UPI0038D18EDC
MTKATAVSGPSLAAGAARQGVRAAAYPEPAAVPTLEGPDGIRFDFNAGARIRLPARTNGQWRVRLTDLDTGNVLFETETKGVLVTSAKRYCVRFGIEIWDTGPCGLPLPVLTHEFDPYDRDVLINVPSGTLGDTIGWFPYAVRFWQTTGCRLTVAMSAKIIPLFRDAYRSIRFVTHEQVVQERLAEQAYATYNLGLFFDDAACVHQPTDFRQVGLHRTAAYILGVDPTEEPPRLAIPDDTRPIPEPYVCIGVQATSQAKYWNNPNGWRAVVQFLKRRGYRVVCIDKSPVHGHDLVWNHIPHGVEDETGDRPLTERARWLRHAEAFIGLSSGLSWLAWAAGTPVVMISGFTHVSNEFATPYRVINWHTCNSCWNDVRHSFDHQDYLWCPRHADTPRQFECTRLITPEHVISTIKQLLSSRRPGQGTADIGSTTPVTAGPARSPLIS